MTEARKNQIASIFFAFHTKEVSGITKSTVTRKKMLDILPEGYPDGPTTAIHMEFSVSGRHDMVDGSYLYRLLLDLYINEGGIGEWSDLREQTIAMSEEMGVSSTQFIEFTRLFLIDIVNKVLEQQVDEVPLEAKPVKRKKAS